MRDFKNCVAVVTGTGSGIGRALALNLASRGANLAISDINEDGLQATAKMLEAFDVKVRADYLDVSKRDDVFAYADAIQEHFGVVNLVINNAGAALSGEFRDTPVDDMIWQMDVNFWGVAYGTKAFLPYLERAEWGHIVNISSLFGLIGSPNTSIYCASKFAVRGMTETLRIELDADNSTVSATSVHPGGIKTNVARSARAVRTNKPDAKTVDERADEFDKLVRTTPEKAAEVILNAAAKNKMRVLVGPDAKLIDKIQRLMPTKYAWFLEKIFGVGED